MALNRGEAWGRLGRACLPRTLPRVYLRRVLCWEQQGAAAGWELGGFAAAAFKYKVKG